MTTEVAAPPRAGRTGPAPGARRLLSGPSVGVLLLIPALAGFGFLFVYPMIGVVIESFTLPTVGVENYLELFTDGYTLPILVRTFYVALIVAVATVVIAYPYAYFMTICGPRWTAILMTIVLIPFWSNATAKNFGLLVLFQRDGLVDRFTELFGIDFPLVNTTPGVVIAMVQVLLPFAVLPLYARLGQINRRLLDAAKGLGASRATAFWKVYFPLSMPGVAAGLSLVFILSLGFYITPAMIGSPQQSLIAQLIMARLEIILDYGGASALGVFLLVVTLVILAASQIVSAQMSRGRARAGAIAGVGGRVA